MVFQDQSPRVRVPWRTGQPPARGPAARRRWAPEQDGLSPGGGMTDSAFRWGRWMVALVCLSLAGCPSNRYEIELKPKGSTMDRSLTCWRKSGGAQGEPQLEPFPAAELEQIAKAYQQSPPPSEARKYTFHGEFIGELPRDIGGSGRHTYWETRMGTLSLYVERFRGDDDLAGAIRARQDAAETFTTLILGWFRSELKNDRDFGKLEEFVDGDFRRDLRNVAVYCWAGQVVAESGSAQRPRQPPLDATEFFVRIAQYFLERGYFTATMMPELARMAQEEDGDRVLEVVRTFVASKMGISSAEQAAQRLDFLKSPEQAKQSLDKFLTGTDQHNAFLRKWQQEHKQDANATPPEPHELLGRVAAEATGLEFSTPDELQVKLECPTEPFATNGTWEADARRVVWSGRTNAAGGPPAPALPALFYAFWSMPNEDFQRERFGKVVLAGEPLAEYCVWRKGLTVAEGEEWDQWLSTLAPDNVMQRLKEFRFSSDAPLPATAEEKPKSLADKPRELIQAGLAGG